MHFAFTEEQQAMAEATRKMLLDRCAPGNLRALIAAHEAYAIDRLNVIRGMGLFGILAPEASGGLALRPADFAAIAELAGYVALPEPFVEQAGIAIPLLASLSDDRGWLAAATTESLVAVGSSISPFVLDADSAHALLL